MPKYLFVCGCPRSGTTALGELLASDPRIAIGSERYLNYRGPITPDLFTKPRFSTPQDGDTFYADLLAHNRDYYKPVLANYDSAIYVGDKLPDLYERFDNLAETIPEARIVMIFRDIFAVAASFEARADNNQDQLWDSGWRTKTAVEKWAASINAFISCPLQILPVFYEQLFLDGYGLEKIFEFLHLGSPPEQTRRRHAELCHWSRQLSRTKQPTLAPEAEAYIRKHAPIPEYLRLRPEMQTRSAPETFTPERLQQLCDAMRYEEAAALLRGIDLDAENRPNVLYYAGVCLGSIGQRQQAVNLLNRARAGGPGPFWCFYHLGIFEKEAGNYLMADQYFRVALSLDPTRTDILSHLQQFPTVGLSPVYRVHYTKNGAERCDLMRGRTPHEAEKNMTEYAEAIGIAPITIIKSVPTSYNG